MKEMASKYIGLACVRSVFVKAAVGSPVYGQHILPAKAGITQREKTSEREREGAKERIQGSCVGRVVVLLTFAAIVPQIAG